jgi:hypothetical protein
MYMDGGELSAKMGGSPQKFSLMKEIAGQYLLSS